MMKGSDGSDYVHLFSVAAELWERQEDAEAAERCRSIAESHTASVGN